MKQLIKDLNLLANSIGMGKGLKSYDKLYKTTINTFGHKDASMWFLTISLTPDNLICGIEINSTYFKPTEQTKAINKVASFDSPITFDQAFNLLKSL